MTECWYEDGCNLYKEGCTKICHRYLEMKYMIDNCGMPNAKKYLKPLIPEQQDLAAYMQLKEIKDGIVNFVNEGNNLYIVSENFGNGKTSWSLKILYKYFDYMWNGNGFRPRGYFVYVPEFLTNLKIMDYRNSYEYKNIAKKLKDCDLVVWDDIASTNLTNSDYANLLSFIDMRVIRDKSNIYTGNLLNEDLQEALGSRLHNRIWDKSVVVTLNGRGRRE